MAYDCVAVFRGMPAIAWHDFARIAMEHCIRMHNAGPADGRCIHDFGVDMRLKNMNAKPDRAGTYHVRDEISVRGLPFLKYDTREKCASCSVKLKVTVLIPCDKCANRCGAWFSRGFGVFVSAFLPSLVHLSLQKMT